MMPAEALYLVPLLMLVGLEVYAIVTNRYDTISELVWRAGKWHWLMRLATLGFMLWATIHLVGGECALGIC